MVTASKPGSWRGTRLSAILAGFLVASGLIGYIWAPRNEGKSLEWLETERA